MLPRQRVISAINFDCPDVAPLRIKGTEGGLRDHGQKLLDLIKRCGHDFGDLSEIKLPAPPPSEDFDSNGNYHAFVTDDWGTTWERRLFDEWGHPVSWPLNDLSKLDEYKAPAPPPFKPAPTAVAVHDEAPPGLSQQVALWTGDWAVPGHVRVRGWLCV